MVVVADDYDLLIFDAYASTAVGNYPEANFPDETIVLNAPHPNPFNDSAILSFVLKETGHLKLSLFNVTGEEVAVLKQGYFKPGTYSADIDGSNLAGGIYFAALKHNNSLKTVKLLHLK